MNQKAISIELKGRVQKVGFRYYVYRLASELGVKGFVKNLPDGTVYVEAESDADHLNVFVDHCKMGPPLSKVSDLKIKDIPQKNYNDFKIC